MIKKPSRYHPLQVSLHWLVVLLIIAAFVLGKATSRVSNEDATKITPLAIHITIGFLTLLAVILRIVARYRLPQPAYASTGNTVLDGLGKFVHIALYVLVLLMAASGISLSVQAGLIGALFGGASLPADFYDFNARLLHGFIAPALLFLVLFHAAAALYHQFVLRDHLLARMWPAK